MTRELSLTRFITDTGWADATRQTVAGDASNRRYDRLIRDTGETAILMDAPPDKGESTEPFVRIARDLTNSGLSAPKIYHHDAAQGFLLIEDLGDQLFFDLMAHDPDREAALYRAAIDVLIRFQDVPTDQLQTCDADWLCDATDLFFDWYVPGDAPQAQDAFLTAFRPLATALENRPQGFVHRDFHAQNLLWLPERSGAARVGLIDFQDALKGHPAYDLASLLQDARRDVSAEAEAAGLAYFIEKSGGTEADFDLAYAVMGLQRNLRILGIFARLSLRDGKPHYVDMIPRVWGYVQRNLLHPGLADLAEILKPLLPEPDRTSLNKLKSKMHPKPAALMMFAAGFGTRMKHLTHDLPKPLIPVAGRPLIDHALDLAREAACDPIVANLHYKPEPLKHHLAPLGVQTVVETPDILETGGGLRNALPVLGAGPVLTQNTDIIWDGPNPIALLQAAWNPDIMDALLICIHPQNAIGYGGVGDFLMDEDGRITRGAGVIYGGIQIMKTPLLSQTPDEKFSLNVVWDRMLESETLFGLTYPGKWCDVGHPEGIALAEDLLDRTTPDV